MTTALSIKEILQMFQFLNFQILCIITLLKRQARVALTNRQCMNYSFLPQCTKVVNLACGYPKIQCLVIIPVAF